MLLLRYTLRRLLLALPTLVGISLVSFALIQLAPGDAASAAGAGRPLSRSEAEAQRRLFFLDLPLLYNGRPRGFEARRDRLCELAADETAGRRERGEAGLVACGTRCLSALVAGEGRCEALPEPSKGRVMAALRRAHPGLGAGDASPRAWAKAALGALEPAKLASLRARLGAEGQSRAVEDALGRRGTAALPAVMELMLASSPASPRGQAASRVVTLLVGIGGSYRGGDTPAQLEAKERRWREWWRQNRRDLVRFDSWDRIHGRITETQYAKWLGRLLRLDFGYSLRDGRPVSAKLAEALPVTLLLSGLAMLIAYLLAVPIGVHAAARAGSRAERATTLLLFLLYSLPPFWVAMLLILLLGGVGVFDVFPIHGLSSPGAAELGPVAWFFDRLWHLVLPVFCLSYGSLAVLSRYQRGALLEALSQDYVRTARAKGLSERRVLWGHALPNALLPTITLVGLHFPYLISGSVIIERIFNIPGMGLLTFEAFLQRDTPVIMAVVVLSATLTLVGLIAADVLYAAVDPRILRSTTVVGAAQDGPSGEVPS